MKKIFYLATCDTCKRILKEIDTTGIELREIKANNVTEAELAEMYALSNSYEALFSKRARKYKELDLKNKNLTEEDYKKYILEEYTFLKRPVAIIDGEIFIGNSKKNVAALMEKLS